MHVFKHVFELTVYGTGISKVGAEVNGQGNLILSDSFKSMQK